MSSYNQDLLKEALKALGKSLLIVTGVGYGVLKALDVLTPERPPLVSRTPDPAKPPAAAEPEATLRRLDGVEERLIRMEKCLEVLAAPVERAAPRASRREGEHFVTRAELNQAMEQLSGSLETDMERRFEVQNRSVQSLRAMIARTDELLEQVIENIESVGVHA